MEWNHTGIPILTEAGYLHITAGCGHQIITGDGVHTITEDGIAAVLMGGYGFPEMSGHLTG